MKVIVLGRHLGECFGWDKVDTNTVCFNDFVPNYKFLAATKLSGPISGDNLIIELESGDLQLIDDEGDEVAKFDAVDLLKEIPR